MPPHEINFIEKRNDHLWIVYTYEAKLVIRLLSLATATILNNITQLYDTEQSDFLTLQDLLMVNYFDISDFTFKEGYGIQNKGN